jgi:hypothetical protein
MLIDLNASFGGRESIQDLGLDVLRHQIERIPANLVLVHCRQGMSDAAGANEQTLAVCAGNRRLRPVGVIDPRDAFTWEREVERCLAAGVRLFRIYPDEGRWSGDSILFDAVVRRLDGTGAVLVVSATTPGCRAASPPRRPARGSRSSSPRRATTR